MFTQPRNPEDPLDPGTYVPEHTLRQVRRARRQRIRRVLLGVGIAVVVLLIALRLALPTLVKGYVNRVLDRDPNYDGSIGDVDIALIRGAYTIHEIQIVDTRGKAPVPLFAADHVDLSVRWEQLFKGALVGEVETASPINFVDASTSEGAQTGADHDWRETVTDLFPLRIDRLAVTDGEVHYSDPTKKPPVDLFVSRIEGEVTNLTNSDKVSETLLATLNATGRPMDLGDAVVKIQLDPYADQPTFNLDFEMRDVELAKLNQPLRAYGKFDVSAGRMDAYAEIAAKEGRFDGYVKPILRGVQVLKLSQDVKEEHDSPLQLAWEGVVGAAKDVLTNPKHDQLASRVPISGSFTTPRVGAWPAVTSVLGNAFVQAISNGLDNSIGWSSAPGAAQDPEAGKTPKDEKKDAREKRRSDH